MEDENWFWIDTESNENDQNDAKCDAGVKSNRYVY